MKQRHMDLQGNHPFSLVFPYMRKERIMDEETNEYITETEQSFGLINILHTWEPSLFSVVEHFPLFWNATCKGTALVGKQKSEWIAQISLETKGGVAYDVARYVFTKKPNAETIMQTNILNQLYMYLQTNHQSLSIACKDCGKEFRWLELEGDLHVKWEHLKERSCGCELIK